MINIYLNLLFFNINILNYIYYKCIEKEHILGGVTSHYFTFRYVAL